MKRIKLMNSKKHFTVSDEDYERVISHDWYLYQSFGVPSSSAWIYAYSYGKKLRLTRFILNENDPKILIDHIDRNPLNNGRSNLRRSTNTENKRNSSKRNGCSSQFKGVSWYARIKRWQSQICVNNVHIHLGFFNSEEEAGKAYDTAAEQYFGEFAVKNFSESNSRK